MKKMYVLLAAAVLFAASPALAAEKTLNGTISDSNCNAKHPGGEHNGKKMTEAECAKACVEGHGAKFVLMSGGKAYTIENQDFEGLKDHAGHKVAMTGDVKGDAITVTKIEMPAAKGSAGK